MDVEKRVQEKRRKMEDDERDESEDENELAL